MDVGVCDEGSGPSPGHLALGGPRLLQGGHRDPTGVSQAVPSGHSQGRTAHASHQERGGTRAHTLREVSQQMFCSTLDM